MKNNVLLFILIFCLQSHAQHFLNLDFEHLIEGTGAPRKWTLVNNNYDAAIDTLNSYSQRNSLRIIDNDSITKPPFIAMSKIPEILLKHDSLVLTAKLKISKVADGFAGIWIRAIDSLGKNLLYQNSLANIIPHDNNWHEAFLKIKIPDNVEEVIFGIIVKGKGKYWIDNFEIVCDSNTFEDRDLSEYKPSEEEIEWLNSVIKPIKNLDTEKSQEDIEFIKNFVGESKILALGEASHGTSEIFKMKHIIIRHLIENMNFNNFLIEAPMLEAKTIESYLKSKKEDSIDLSEKLLYWTWNTKEVLDLINWMKYYSQKKNVDIGFSGFDVQSNKMAGSLLLKYFKGESLDSLKVVLKDIDNAKSSKDYFEIYNRYKKLKKMVQNQIIKSEYIKATKDKLLLSLNLMDQYLEFKFKRKSRDKNMAKNVNYIIQHEGLNGTILWAHNGHIKRTGGSMGEYLLKEYGEDYLSIGFAYHDGFYNTKKDSKIQEVKSQTSFQGTYEYYLKSANSPMFFINLKEIQRNTKNIWLFESLEFRIAGATYQADEFFSTDLVKDFDAIIFISSSTPSHLLSK